MKNLSLELSKVVSLACRASIALDTSLLTLRANGAAITSDRRNELLARIRAGEHVELEAELLAYEQRTGEHNRNFVRFRDGALISLGRSGKGTPFLRDHEQDNSLAKAGRVMASATEKRGDGDYAIRQTVRLTAPWAVELALRDLLDAVSIGWRPTGPVNCSACNSAVFTRCYHFPGDRLVEREVDDGSKRLVRAADGDVLVEWIYTEAELVETSFVPIGGVPTAAFEGIRAALSAQFPEARLLLDSGEEFTQAKDEHVSKMLAVLAATLSLAPTASEEETIKAVQDLKRERDTLSAELNIAEAERVKLAAQVDTYQAAEKKTAEDAFIRDALATGRISTADEGAWRDLYQLSSEKATKRLAEKKAGSASPVGQPLQSAVVPAETNPQPAANAVNAALTANGVNPQAALHFAKAFGATNPEKSIAKAIGMNEEG